MHHNVGPLILIFVLPLVPSFILFKALPSEAVVQGPFQGLKINLGGGFAGYFILFITLISIRHAFFDETFEKWTVTGRIAPCTTADSAQYVDPRYVTFSTPALRTDSDGNFMVEFIRTPDSDEFDYPELYITYPGCERAIYFLGPKDKNQRGGKIPPLVDTAHRRIELGDVTLSKSTPPSTGPQQQSAPATILNPYR